MTIDDVDRVLGGIADGNLAIDVTENEGYYIGDFRALFESLRSIHANLMRMIRDIFQIAHQVDASADRVSMGALALSQGTMEQAASISGLVFNVTAITSQIQSSASQLVDKATGYADEADMKMEQLMTATTHIDQSSAQIVTIIKTIEDIAFRTNILALNASVEAVRAGAAEKSAAVSMELTDQARTLNNLISRFRMG